MEITHKIEMIDGIEQIVMYVRYPDEYEFSLDFDSMKKKVSSVADKIREYALKNIGKVNDNTVLLIMNGVVVGTLLLSQLATPNLHDTLPPRSEIATTISDENSNIDKKAESIAKEETIVAPLQEVTEVKNTTTQKPTNTQPTVTKPNNNNTSNGNNNATTTPPSTPVYNGPVINLKLSSGKIIKIGLEDYVIGVVGSEMPAEFNAEALKAQAVAARTYALKRTSTGASLTATTADQVYKTDAELKSMWGNTFNTYYTKVKNAVNATKGEVALYNGQYIDALYYSTSNGRTEDSYNVWGFSYPYLKSVESPWDVGVRGYEQTKTVAMSTISQKFGVNLTSISQIKINSKTAGNRVESITICGKEFTGVKIRSVLGLRSADFDISVSGNSIVFTTRGYGHGVGMSQYGANGMAKAGSNYTQILKHYYPGITIAKR